MPIERHGTHPWMSDIVVHAGTVYLSGAVARDAGQGIEQQTLCVLSQIDERLERVGSSRASLLMAQIWLCDPGDFFAMNRVWEAWLGDAPRPARATVQAGLMLPGLRVEIAIVAAQNYLPESHHLQDASAAD
jgi:enamine deaminase RidA (YjgF/YER057c/UK114 family)